MVHGAAAVEAPEQQMLVELVSAGAALLSRVRQVLEGAAPGRRQSTAPAFPADLVKQDEATGRAYLNLPLPRPETLRRIASMISAFAEGK